ncbi:MAG: PrgI family protein [bacterium]|nr:PrgI family protein [bacterium]
MRYQIPQFIERETKIFGPLSFRQFFYVGIVGVIVFLLYFTIAKANFPLFLVITIFLTIGALIFAFVRIEGKPLITALSHFLIFSVSSRIYLWQRKEIALKLIKLERKPKEEKIDEGPVLKISGKGRLEKLSTKIEIKIK